MGLNVGTARRLLFTSLQQKGKLEKNENKTEDTVLKESSLEIKSKDDFITQNVVDTFSYFTLYDQITSRLGNFYSEYLAKMTGSEIDNKRVFNNIYNTTMNNVITKALEEAKSGTKTNVDELVQEIKNTVIAELEACNYNPVKYDQNIRDEQIVDSFEKFSV